MDLGKVLAHLHAELNNLDAAIACLERLQQGDRRRGLPVLKSQRPGRKTAQRGAIRAKLDSLHAGEHPSNEDT
jgi:hypothetical protein